jgi:hypothetical protein
MAEAIPSPFRDWGSLKDKAAGAGAVLLWVPSGPAAAIVKVLRQSAPPGTLFMTHALNPPGVELMEMTGGLWEGMVFPSILVADPVLIQAYDAVIRKYGPPGLEPGYLSYLGVAQAQVMTRLLVNQDAGTTREEVRRDFLGVDAAGTMLVSPGFGAGPPRAGAFFLARATRSGGWAPAGDPEEPSAARRDGRH